MASQTMSAPSSTNNIAQNTMATLVGDEDFGHGQSRESLKDIGTIDDHADTRDVTRVSEQVVLPVIPAPTVRPIATRPVDTPEIRRAAYEVTLSEKHSLSMSSITESGTDSSGQSTPSLKSPSAFEKGIVLPWDGYLMDSMPEKTQGHYVRNIRHQILSLYRRLFGIVFVANVSIFIAALACDTHQSNHLGLIVTANLFCAILMRQDYVINAFFKVFTSVPLSWPLKFRRICAEVYHIGGLHSGCAVSGLLWLVLFTAQATHELTSGGPAGVLTVAISYCILLLLIVIVGLAYPHFRKVQHNKFEASHRFLGWTATALVWVQVISLNNDYRLPGQSLSYALVHSTPFWLVVVLTASIISPWLRLRKVPVRAVVLSQHAVRFYFDYVTPVSGSFTRVSTTPLTEWHGFATIAEPGKQGYSMIVSRAGDWTSSQIENPPTHIWVRGIPVCGVIHVVTMFRRILLVATGSGIAPCTPSILEQRVPIRLLWVSPNVRETFGDDFVDSLLEKSPDPVIYDTRKHGKPDMVKLTYRAARDFNAEAVCIISNEKLTKKVVYGLNSRGIPTFGAIWDS